jgi:hypothetical protein
MITTTQSIDAGQAPRRGAAVEAFHGCVPDQQTAKQGGWNQAEYKNDRCQTYQAGALAYQVRCWVVAVTCFCSDWKARGGRPLCECLRRFFFCFLLTGATHTHATSSLRTRWAWPPTSWRTTSTT